MDVSIGALSKQFGHVRALDGISLSCASGARIALVGPNGSGKSTLTRILMGLLHYNGTISLGGLDPLRDRLRLAVHLAYVPQTPPQIAAPVKDLVTAIGSIRGLDRREFASVATKLALDLQSIWHRPFRDLSGGMKQKTLIALAFAAPFSLLILDEPTASLDPEARARFEDLFLERAESSTVFISSHRIEEVQHWVERVVVLDAGQINFDDSVSRFFARNTNSGYWVPAAPQQLAGRFG